MRVFSKNLHDLQMDGQMLMASFEENSEQHREIHETITREQTDLKKEKGEIMSSLWTFLGGNAHEIQGFEETQQLLNKVQFHEDRAVQCLTVILVALGRMHADLEDLRRRVSEPLLVPRRAVIPVREQAYAVKLYTDRMKKTKESRKARLMLWNQVMHKGYQFPDHEKKIIVEREYLDDPIESRS